MLQVFFNSFTLLIVTVNCSAFVLCVITGGQRWLNLAYASNRIMLTYLKHKYFPSGLVDVKVAIGGIFDVNTGPSQKVDDVVGTLHVGIGGGNLFRARGKT